MLGNFVKMTKQNKTDNYSSTPALSQHVDEACRQPAIARDNCRLIYICPDALASLAWHVPAPPPPLLIVAIASYGSIVRPNAHKLCKLNCQSCRRIGANLVAVVVAIAIAVAVMTLQ